MLHIKMEDDGQIPICKFVKHACLAFPEVYPQYLSYDSASLHIKSTFARARTMTDHVTLHFTRYLFRLRVRRRPTVIVPYLHQ